VLFVVALWLAASCQADPSTDAKLDSMKAQLDMLKAQQDELKAVISLMARENLESAVDDRGTGKFVRSSTCASDAPTTSLPLGDVQGIPGGVSGPARCSIYCQDLSGCLAFNFRNKPTSDGTQCQLYTKAPATFAATSDCQFYKTTTAVTAVTAVAVPVVQDEVLVQQNYGGSTFFQRTWAEFKQGFGDVNGNYWIGNDRLHELTKNGVYKLRVELQLQSDSKWYYVEYATFIVGDESSGYVLSVGGYSGNKGDSLTFVNGIKFSTKDRDNDNWANNCAADAHEGNGGGFWYNVCSNCFINSPATAVGRGFNWQGEKLLASRMKMMRH